MCNTKYFTQLILAICTLARNKIAFFALVWRIKNAVITLLDGVCNVCSTADCKTINNNITSDLFKYTIMHHTKQMPTLVWSSGTSRLVGPSLFVTKKHFSVKFSNSLSFKHKIQNHRSTSKYNTTHLTCSVLIL